jgi:cellulose synthase/poly-beta-1,6-N-acetylglucosamine synthase-like glycosyltransferase
VQAGVGEPAAIFFIPLEDSLLECAMKMLFWLCVLFIVYAYVGYPLLLWFISRYRSRPFLAKRIAPTVSIIMAVRNEEKALPAKLENLRRLDYPRDLVQIIVASDGSSDGTVGILKERSGILLPIILKDTCGKAAALNEAAKWATGEILVFTDVRQMIDASAISELTACFWDPEVGGASGELMLEGEPASPSNALGTYWKIEKLVRKLESASGSVIGATGALYAVRRSLYEAIPSTTILDDVVIPMNIVRRGNRVVFQASAIARDRLSTEKGKEFSRKVRTMTGNYQLLWLAPWLLSPANPVLWRYVSHKFIRLLCPWLLILMPVASGMSAGPIYRVAFAMQIALYCVALFGTLFPFTRRLRLVKVTSTFVMLNAAAALAFYNFITGRRVIWR